MTDKALSDHAALLLRISMGIMFLAHGFVLKVLTFTPAGTAAFFESIGYPGFLGYVVIAAEITGGLALIAGIQVRLVSLAFVPIMIGATIQHLGNGWTFSNPSGEYEFPAFWTILLFVQALVGNGALAADSLLRSRQARPATLAAA